MELLRVPWDGEVGARAMERVTLVSKPLMPVDFCLTLLTHCLWAKACLCVVSVECRHHPCHARCHLCHALKSFLELSVLLLQRHRFSRLAGMAGMHILMWRRCLSYETAEHKAPPCTFQEISPSITCSPHLYAGWHRGQLSIVHTRVFSNCTLEQHEHKGAQHQ